MSRSQAIRRSTVLIVANAGIEGAVLSSLASMDSRFRGKDVSTDEGIGAFLDQSNDFGN